MARNGKKNLKFNATGNIAGSPITTVSSNSTNWNTIALESSTTLKIDDDLIYKNKKIEDWMDEKILEMVRVLFGEEKAKEYEKYLKSKELVKNIEKK